MHLSYRKTALLMFVLTSFCALTANYAHAEETEQAVNDAEDREASERNVFLSYGGSAAWLTRIIKQDGRSNFVFRDFLPGLYLDAELRNIPFVTPVARLAVYYPLVSTFNYVPQKPNTPLHFAADFLAGVLLEKDWKWIKVNGGPALHMLFMGSDRWNYCNIGFALGIGADIALGGEWSLLFDGFASIDNGNLGSNKQMEPYDITYQYQAGIGVRYIRTKKAVSALRNRMSRDSAV